MESKAARELPTFINIMRWTDEEARQHLESRRWPNGAICPKCGAAEPYRFQRTPRQKTPDKPRVNRVTSLYKCRACKRQFTVTTGTIFEDSHIPLSKWIGAMYLMCASKKSVSAHQLHRQLEVTYKTAWFMCHRIRDAMRDKEPVQLSGTIEADETFIGPRKKRNIYQRRRTTIEERQAGAPNEPSPHADKEIVFGMVERGGKARTKHIPAAKRDVVRPIMQEHIDMANARLMTDESPIYRRIREDLPHEIIRHKSEYVRGDVHTNSIESYWSILKRGLVGTYHHVDAAYLGQYLQEYEFRFNARTLTDAERFDLLLSQVQGRVLWYCETEQPENPFA